MQKGCKDGIGEGANTHGRGSDSLLFGLPLQDVVLLVLLPQAIHFATCRAGFVADWPAGFNYQEL